MLAALFHRLVGRPIVVATNTVRKIGRHRRKHALKRWKVARELARNGMRRAYTAGVSGWRRLRRIHKPFVRLARRTTRTGEVFAARRAEWSVLAEIRRAARTRDTLVLGPWFSEVGFEALYWLPFTRWVAAEFGLEANRVVAVSRGGVASWYRDVAARYVEIFDAIEPAVLAARNEERRVEGDGSRKQLHPSGLDRELLEDCVRRIGIDRYAVLHPSLMYRLLRRFWLGQQPLTWVQAYTRPARIVVAPGSRRGNLPDEYIAVKFYRAASMPDAPATRAAMRALLDAASRIAPVVLLDTGLVFDEHDDYAFQHERRIVSARHLMSASDNLGVQTEIIRDARLFIGTCGSIAWLAPLLGVPTIGVMADDKFLHPHLYFARQAYRAAGAAPFMTVDVRALERFDLAGLVAAQAAARV